MKKIIVITIMVCCAISASTACDHFCHCPKHATQKSVGFEITITRANPSAVIVTNTPQQQTVVTQIVVQPVVERTIQPVQVVTVPLLEPVGYYRGAYYNNSFVSAGASISIGSYGGYYPSTYLQMNSRRQEYHNIRQTQRNYGIRPNPPGRHR